MTRRNKLVTTKNTKMKNKIFVTIFGMILLIGIVSALDISLDAGENYVINFGNDNPVNWTISGIDEGYLNISQVNSYVTISLDKYAPSSNFSIDFYTMKEQTESSTSGGSGGGYDPNWKNPATIVNPVNTTSTNQNITEEKEPSNETSTTNNVTDSKFPVWIIITILLIVIGLFLLVRKIISNKEREGDEEEYGEE